LIQIKEFKKISLRARCCVMPVRRAIGPGLFAVLSVVGCAAGRLSATSSPALGTQVDIVAPDLRGVEVRVAAAAGQVRVIDFWASWCEPCRDLIPALDRLARAHQAEGLLVYGVSVDEDRAQLDAWLTATPVSYQQLWDRGGARHAERLAIERLPTTLVLDRAGRVRFVHQGFQPADADLLAVQVKALLAEPR
jgi:cytochrome c biogenesis protein CcmG/thiol:disulfide interchange protein DsbE